MSNPSVQPQAADRPPIVVRAAAKVLRTPGVGQVFSRTVRHLGLTGISRWSSRYSGFVPLRVPIKLSDGAVMQMMSADGNDHIVREIWMFGLPRYEASMPTVYQALVRGCEDVIDVGANSGLYALIASRAAAGTVHAFEPFPDALRWLRENIALNNAQKTIAVVEAAAGEADGSLKLYIPEKRFGSTLETSASLESDFRPRHHAVIDVRVTSLDAYAPGTIHGRVGLVRIDVEGAEYRVLGGASRVIAEHRPYVFVEVLSGVAAERLTPFAEKSAMRAFVIEEAGVRETDGIVADPQHTNQLWCPAEKVGAMSEALSKVGLEVRAIAR